MELAPSRVTQRGKRRLLFARWRRAALERSARCGTNPHRPRLAARSLALEDVVGRAGRYLAWPLLGDDRSATVPPEALMLRALGFVLLLVAAGPGSCDNGGSSSDGAAGETSKPSPVTQCQTYATTWCNKSLGCYVQLGRIDADTAQTDIDECVQRIQDGLPCTDVTDVADTYDKCNLANQWHGLLPLERPPNPVRNRNPASQLR